jgi:hypothetical protein
MKSFVFVPQTARAAGNEIRRALATPLGTLPKPAFLRAWSSLAYLFPGLHPDGFDDSDSGWPRSVRPFAAEAWRRAEAGELADDELYPGDAQWAGLYDRMSHPTPDETERRREITALSAQCAHA